MVSEEREAATFRQQILQVSKLDSFTLCVIKKRALLTVFCH